MNQGRIWCVVHPTVGLPLLLGSVTVLSLVVHASVMSNTTWMSRYWQGGPKANKTAETSALTPGAAGLATQPGFSVSVAPVAAVPGKAGTSFVVTVAPNAPPSAPVTASAPAPASPPPKSEKVAAAMPRSP